ncbi:MAG: dienelactone hydrolase family protein [Bacteroidota bacterium]
MKRLLVYCAMFFLLVSCTSDSNDTPIIPTDDSMDPPPLVDDARDTELEDLPKDIGGSHSANRLGDSDANFGYYLYTPGNYVSTEGHYPLLVFLHGGGEVGNSQVSESDLLKVLQHGPPRLINQGEWNPAHPMLVASPQLSVNNWRAVEIHEFITFLIQNYRVNPRRIYLTGLSRGGYGTFNYVGDIGKESYVAAAIPICGGGTLSKADQFKNTPIWAFHGSNDNIVPLSNSINMINSINNQSPEVRAKLTIYPGVGHDSWTITYNGEGMGSESTSYDSFDTSIYDWFLSFKKN